MHGTRKSRLSAIVVPRRAAIKGLGAWAVSGTAFAAIGCGSDQTTTGASAASAQAGASATSTGSPAAKSSVPAGSSAAGTAGAHASPAAAGRSSVGSVTATPAAGTSGSAGTSQAGAGGSAAAGGAGAPAASGTGGSAADGTAAVSGGASDSATTTLDMLQCLATPAMEDGPFFVEEKLERSNLLMGETDEAIAMGVPLRLAMGIYKVQGMMCEPISGLQVDIWHANAMGEYSDVASGFVQSVDTQGKKYLRGYQRTDEQGMVAFDTIYPGWYQSRTIHIHFKLRMSGTGNTSYNFTSQMFFDEAINAMVLGQGVYAKRTGTRMVLNDNDHIFNGQPVGSTAPPANGMAPGKLIMPKLVAMGAGYEATLKIGLTM